MNEPIHPLRRWLFENNETAASFSARTGITQAHLSRVMRRKKRPHIRTIDKISVATNMAVTANDFQQVEQSDG